MPPSQQSQHLALILERDRPQVPMPQRHDRSRARVMRIALVLAARVQQASSCRQRRRDIDDGLTDRDELLREQRAMTGRAFDGPQARLERCRPTQQP
jgi:hypothetical protein